MELTAGVMCSKQTKSSGKGPFLGQAASRRNKSVISIQDFFIVNALK